MSEPRERLSSLRIDRQDTSLPRTPRTAILVGALVLVIVALVAAWFWRQPAAKVRTAVASPLTGAAAASSAVLDASGYVVARQRATVSSKVTGRVVEVLVEEGMVVEKGQVLARLDDAIATRQVALAQAQIEAANRSLAETQVLLEEARITLGRTRQLVSGEVSTAAQLDADQASYDAIGARLERLRSDVEVAERQLSLRRQELDDTVIRAPFKGIAVTKDAQPGEMISPVSAGGGFTRTGICTVVDMGSLEIEVDVNEAYIGRVKPGQRVLATLDAYPEWKIPASVIIPVPTADRQKATVRVRIAFAELDARILPDMGVKVSFLSEDVGVATDAANPANPAVLIPQAAVRQDGDQPVVFVLADGKVQRRAVRLGGRDADRVAVIAGLSSGEQVVVEGPDDLHDGDLVVVR